MAEAIIERLREMADIQLDIEFCSLLIDAADMIEQLSEEVNELEKNRSCMTVTVSLSNEQLRNAFDSALEDYTGKNFDYVIEAVKEKMIREGELDEKENT